MWQERRGTALLCSKKLQAGGCPGGAFPRQPQSRVRHSRCTKHPSGWAQVSVKSSQLLHREMTALRVDDTCQCESSTRREGEKWCTDSTTATLYLC
jgi:hypothetical protein